MPVVQPLEDSESSGRAPSTIKDNTSSLPSVPNSSQCDTEQVIVVSAQQEELVPSSDVRVISSDTEKMQMVKDVVVEQVEEIQEVESDEKEE